MNKECLITIGATAKFPELISAALMPGCLQKLKDNGFTHLNIQYGDSKELFETLRPGTLMGLDIQGFDFNQNGLHNEMARCQAREGISQNGMIICHAGVYQSHGISIRLTCTRSRDYFGCHENGYSINCCPESHAFGQSSRRVGGRVGEARLCDERHYQVCEHLASHPNPFSLRACLESVYYID